MVETTTTTTKPEIDQYLKHIDDFFKGESEPEVGMLYKAEPFIAAFRDQLPTREELLDLTSKIGMEAATRVFATSLRSAAPHAALARAITDVKAESLRRLTPGARDYEVTVVASRLPQGGEWRSHAEEWCRWAREMGFTTDIIETSPRNTIVANAREIGQHLRFKPHAKRIILTHGQGALEVRSLLEAEHRRGANAKDMPAPVAWFNIAGPVGGARTSTYLTEGRVQRWLSKMQLKFSGRNPAAYWETSNLNSHWREPMAISQKLLVFNVLGLCLSTDIAGQTSFELFDHLSKRLPNDGGIDCFEAMVPGALTLAIRGMNQKDTRGRLEPVLRRLLLVTLGILQTAEHAREELARLKVAERIPLPPPVPKNLEPTYNFGDLSADLSVDL